MYPYLRAQENTKHSSVNEALGYHVIKKWCLSLSRDGRIGHTTDTIKFSGNESNSRLFCSLTNALLCDSRITNLFERKELV